MSSDQRQVEFQQLLVDHSALLYGFIRSLVLDANDELSDLATTLSKLQIDASGPISITGNEGISDCEAQDYVDGLPGHTVPVTIADNDAC